MAKKKTTKKPTPPSVPPAPEGSSGLSEELDLLIKRPLGTLGTRFHEAFTRLPESLKITRQDAVAMHVRIDENSRLKSVSYWMFIFSSCGIATLGLLINSPAVIIGAMLVSPLMSPIIGLGMSIGLRDVYMGVKSIISILLSLAVAAATAGLITVIVPDLGITEEISARTHPTVLDLFIALFCGIVATLSSVRSKGQAVMSDVAPGAAIGVALMPPVCVIGYGLFKWKLAMAWGAFLLFTTNLAAIIMVSSVLYYFIYDSYDSMKLIRLRNKARDKDEVFFNSPLQVLWENKEHDISRGRRFWFPIIFLALIMIPLLSSLILLKRQVDMRGIVEESIRSMTRKEIPGYQAIRGAENLIITPSEPGGVQGEILYASDQPPPVGFTKRLNKSVADNFLSRSNIGSDYTSDIQFIRIAGSADLERVKLESQEAIRLEKSRTSLEDKVGHARAAELVGRALNLLQNSMAAEDGVIANVYISYSVNGMQDVMIEYVGRNFSAETRATMERTFRRTIKGFKGDVKRVVLKRVGSRQARHECRGPRRSSPARAAAALRRATGLLENNPNLKIQARTTPGTKSILVAGLSDPLKTRVKIVEDERSPCLLDYKYYH